MLGWRFTRMWDKHSTGSKPSQPHMLALSLASFIALSMWSRSALEFPIRSARCTGPQQIRLGLTSRQATSTVSFVSVCDEGAPCDTMKVARVEWYAAKDDLHPYTVTAEPT